MPTFKISDIFKITDRGHVLSGSLVSDGSVLSGDSAVLTIGHDQYIFKIIGINIQKEAKNFGLLISFADFSRLSQFELKDKELKILNVSDRKSLTNEPISWTGDLSDDCTAIWAGLMLRAEWMDGDTWWWAVSDVQNNDIEIDSSNNYDHRFKGGPVSRRNAEEVAKRYLNVS